MHAVIVSKKITSTQLLYNDISNKDASSWLNFSTTDAIHCLSDTCIFE